MLRSEIQSKTGLTRKAIEYYEERGLIQPTRAENGYRNYSEKDLQILTQVSQLRKVGLTITEIEEFLCSGISVLSCVLRKKQHQLEIEDRRKSVLEMILKGADNEAITHKLEVIEKEETIYEKLERAFPGYFGQMLFISYQPFLNESLRKEGEEAYDEYVKYLDSLPPFELSDEEREHIEKISSSFDLEILKKFNEGRMAAVENPKEWWNEHEDKIKQYERFKKSDEYLKSPIKRIKDQLQKYMAENRYYEVAIPLIRKFSKSYNDYYMKLIAANDECMKRMKGNESIDFDPK